MFSNPLVLLTTPCKRLIAHQYRTLYRVNSTTPKSIPNLHSTIPKTEQPIAKGKIITLIFIILLLGSQTINIRNIQTEHDDNTRRYRTKIEILESLLEKIKNKEIDPSELNLDDELKIINKSFRNSSDKLNENEEEQDNPLNLNDLLKDLKMDQSPSEAKVVKDSQVEQKDEKSNGKPRDPPKSNFYL